MKYADIRDFVSQGLANLGYASANPDTNESLRTMPLINVGPSTIASLQKLSAGPIVFLTIGNGIGPTTELLYDQVFLTVRVIGMQNDYDYAEKLAYDIDTLFLRVDSNADIGSTRVLYITRTGGAPQLIDFDSSNRYHFQNTYITENKTGI